MAPPIKSVRPYLDPNTMDWVIQNGRLVDDATHASSVLFLIDHQRGTSIVYPNLGSRFWTIKKILPNTLRTVEIMAKEALFPLIRDRKIFDVVPVATRENKVHIVLKVSWRDARGKTGTIEKIIAIGRS